MRKFYLFGLVMFAAIIVLGQNKVAKQLSDDIFTLNMNNYPNVNRSLSPCDDEVVDTLLYPLLKENLLGNGIMNAGELEYLEKQSQAYINNGTITISGVTFYGNVLNPTGLFDIITVNVYIYNVDNNNKPTTAITSTPSIAIVSGGTLKRINALFIMPVSVSGNFAVVIENNTSGKILNIGYNNATATTYGEGLSYIYYNGSNGLDWYTNEAAYGQDVDALISPVITYSANSDFITNPNPPIVEIYEDIEFTANSTPTSILNSHTLNYEAFRDYFNLTTNDSTYYWDMDDGSNLIWQANHTYNYSDSGTYNVKLYTMYGLWNRCTQVGNKDVIVNYPSVAVEAAPDTICPGLSSILTASGVDSYEWSTGATSSSITVTPSTTTTYSVTGTKNGLTSSAEITVVIDNHLSINVTANPQNMCIGDSSVITAEWADSYQWSTGATSSSIIVYPTSNTTYYVTGTKNGCSGTRSISITVLSTPDVSIFTLNDSICEGSSANLIASGADSYLWSSGQTGIIPGMISVSPTSTTTYTVTGYNNSGCSDTASITIVVSPAPTVSISASATIICSGEVVTLTASGADTYLWSGGLLPSSQVTVSPTSTTTYTVTGTSNACSSTDAITITVKPSPNLSVVANPYTICESGSSVLTASGAQTYQWSTGVSNSGQITVSPTGMGAHTYTVTGTTNDCSATATVTVAVYPIPDEPTITQISTNPIVLKSSYLTGNQWYNLNGPITNATNQLYTVSQNGSYFVIVTINGCPSAPSDTITIDNVSIQFYNNDDLVIYPNPADEIIFIKSDKNISEIVITDAIGRIVATYYNVHQINISNLPEGYYNINIKLENKNVIKPLIIQRF
ncbi:MAG: T9SS type A sorting domain-containing protein [Bacteroidales bacterium]|nr:T9SS type A sorting domain-containing protein [Bacteroidales bacterium]